MCADTSPESPLPYSDTGSGPPVLLIHGLLSAPSLWSTVALRLSERFRVICCDLRRAAGAPPAYGVGERRADGLIALMDRLDLASAHVVTHGSGCATGTALAARAPARVRTIAVVDPVVPRTDSPSAIQTAWHLENLLQWLAVAYGNAVRAPHHVAAIQAIVAEQTHASLCEPAPTPFLSAAAPNGDTAASSITCPLLALTGEQNSPEAKAMVGRLFGGVAALRWTEVPGAGRHSPREAPAATARLLEQFLAANG